MDYHDTGPQFFLFFLCLLAAASGQQSCPGDPDLVVRVRPGGCVRGIRNADQGNQRAWLGIPYAEKPLGSLRFAHPLPNQPWSDVYEASTQPNACQQTADNTWPGFAGMEQWNPNTNVSEDCLYLNVHAPEKIEDGPLPVLVWIYGGGFNTGSVALDVYRPERLVERGVVFVAMQYRVNVLGFLSMGEGSGAPGNAGLMDQALALQWVQDNVASFGGDPDKVTIMGESAGAAGVALHLASPRSCRLFHQAILQSGSLYAIWGYEEQDKAKANAEGLAKKVGCTVDEEDPAATVKCLREKDPKDLREAVDFRVQPVRDNVFVTAPSRRSMKQSLYSKKPLLLGTNADEGFWVLLLMNKLLEIFPLKELSVADRTLSADQFREKINAQFFAFPAEARRMLADYYVDLLPGPMGHFYSLETAMADGAFHCGVERLARGMAQHGKNVYRYHYEHRSSRDPFPEYMGVIHGQELGFTFGGPLFKEETSKFSQAEIEFDQHLISYWTNFVKYGSPNSASSPGWPRFTSSTGWRNMNLNLSISEKEGQFTERCKLWDQVMDVMHSAGDKEWEDDEVDLTCIADEEEDNTISDGDQQSSSPLRQPPSSAADAGVDRTLLVVLVIMVALVLAAILLLAGVAAVCFKKVARGAAAVGQIKNGLSNNAYNSQESGL